MSRNEYYDVLEYLRDYQQMSRDEFSEVHGSDLTDALDKMLADERVTFVNSMQDLQQFLSPEWEEAEEIVFGDGNFGWAMIAKEAVRLRCEKANGNNQTNS